MRLVRVLSIIRICAPRQKRLIVVCVFLQVVFRQGRDGVESSRVDPAVRRGRSQEGTDPHKTDVVVGRNTGWQVSIPLATRKQCAQVCFPTDAGSQVLK